MTHPNFRRPPTNRKVDPERLAALAAAGLPLRRIAAELAVAACTARRWQTRLGLPAAALAPPPNRKVDPAEFAAMTALGYSLGRIAASFGIADTTARF